MSGDDSRTVADVVAIAREKGLVVIAPRPNDLFIDIDSDEQWDACLRALTVFSETCERYYGARPSIERESSPSGRPGRYHVIVTLLGQEPSLLDRIRLQAMLGSDLVREQLALRRILAGAEEDAVTVFFERPDSVFAKTKRRIDL